jgi:hypothetical protein
MPPFSGILDARPFLRDFVRHADVAKLGTSLDFQGDGRTVEIQMADRPRRPRRKAGIVFVGQAPCSIICCRADSTSPNVSSGMRKILRRSRY